MDGVLERKPNIISTPAAPITTRPPLLPIDDVTCFTHASLHGVQKHAFEAPEDMYVVDYERLENMGDAILKASLTVRIYELYPRIQPSGASAIRAALDCNEHLAVLCAQYELQDKLHAIRGSSDRLRASPNVRADVFEAYVAAMFNQYGWEQTHRWLSGAFDADLRATYTRLKKAADLRATAAQSENASEFISLLEMWKGRDPPNRRVSYEDAGQSGAAHQPMFEMVCRINGEDRGRGMASRKKGAKALAAQEACIYLGLVGGEYMAL